MTPPVNNETSTWSRSAVPAARRWLVIPLLLALLGAIGGLAAGINSRASAEALILVRANTLDSSGLDRAAANAALELNTREIFDAAAEETGGDAADLQSRADIATVTDSQVVSVTVTAPTAEQAVEEANAIAEAGVAAGPDRTPEALAKLTESTRDLITSENLNNASAERARVARLGDELGASQAILVAQANQLQLLQNGEPNRLLPSGTVLGLMGALAGGLLGLGIALLLGVRRGTVRSARELSDLYPQAAVISSADLKQALEMEPDARTVIVAGTRGARLSRVTETVLATLVATTGKKVVLADSLANAPVNESSNGSINLVTTTLSETVLRRTTHDEGSVLIVPVQPRVTKLEAVDEFASRMSARSYLLLDDRAPEWD